MRDGLFTASTLYHDRYKHMDMADLERCLAEASEKGARIKVGRAC